ncbi:Nitrogen permease regulator 3 [[Candida] zeylanoides]
MSFNLPNSYLLGILLVVSTHSGPQLVYSYPPVLSHQHADRTHTAKSILTDDSDEYEESGEDDEYIVDSASDSEEGVASPGQRASDDDSRWNARNLNFYMGTKKDLMSFLDDQERHRQRQLKTEPGAVSPAMLPSRADGSFLEKTVSARSARSERSAGTAPSSPVSQQQGASAGSPMSTASTPVSGRYPTIFGLEPDYLCETLCPPREMCNARFELLIDDLVFLGLPVHAENGQWRRRRRGHRSSMGEAEPAGDTAAPASGLNSFHLVFIVNPPIIETNYRIDEMFHYVISRLSLVLRHEQAKHDYVWSQVKLIQRLREEFRAAPRAEPLTTFLAHRSSLCKMVADCFESISRSEIANLSVNGKLRSFQIPIKTEFLSLPRTTVPYLPGSHLSSSVGVVAKSGLVNVGDTTRYATTAADGGGAGRDAADTDTDTDTDLDADANDIIYYALLLLDDAATIVADIKAEPHSMLATFIRMIRPTESLARLAQVAGSSLSLSEIKSFAFHLIYWRRARVIPPLSSRSSYIVSPMAPVTLNLYKDIHLFSRHFPSLPSLPHFLKSLSATSRKPKQYANIIPSRDHREVYLEALGWLIRYGYVTQLHTFIWLKISRKIRMRVEEDLENEGIAPTRAAKAGAADASVVGASTGADNTSKPPQQQPLVAPQSHIAAHIVLEEESDTLILDPERATTLERRWINKIITDECHLSAELTQVFFKLLRYMNGKSSLELLLIKEGVSRSELRKLLFAIEDHIVSVRHW